MRVTRIPANHRPYAERREGSELSIMLTRAQAQAMAFRSGDLLAQECKLVAERRITWAGRLSETQGMGCSGGSTAERRLIIEAMAAIERRATNPLRAGL